MNPELEVLKDVTGRLESAGIPYMVTGSVALNFYSEPRMTRDIDLVVEAKEADGEKIFSLFANDFYVDRESLFDAVMKRRMFNMIHNEHVVKVDMIVRKDTPYREKEFNRRRRMELAGTAIWFVSPEDLVLSKLLWAKESLSELQFRDVRSLMRVVQDIDTRYLETWAKSLGLEGMWRKVENG